MADPDVSVFIPAYNAASHISSVIDRFSPRLWRRTRKVWIINDGSTDGTDAAIEALARRHEAIHPVHSAVNRGYGHTVRRGLSLCRDDGCDYAACVHADGQYPPEAVLDFVEAMRSNRIDLMQGSRIASGTALSGGMPLYKYAAGRMLTVMENAVFGLRMTDYHSGFLVYSRKCLRELPVDRLSGSFDFDLEVIAAARARRFSIGELPIPTRYAGEVSHLKPFIYGLSVLGVLVKYLAGHYKDSGKI
ncbi:MAG: glycosyltransferase family 2 protein [Chitinispirillaceae bacterium]|nr:glycosyltransferase family 2 protein [Chitinispirillaceae bacterium]